MAKLLLVLVVLGFLHNWFAVDIRINHTKHEFAVQLIVNNFKHVSADSLLEIANRYLFGRCFVAL